VTQISALKRVRSLILPVVVGVLVAVAALLVKSGGNGGSAGASSPAVATGGAGAVEIKNYSFLPARLTVRAGTKVAFTNQDATAHTATADTGGLDSGTIAPGGSKPIVFATPGTYAYHCAFHAFMTATVTVK
jgi:plastocyanin